jgi:hypothetical protein
MEETLTLLIGKYGWLLLTGFLMFFFKGAIESLYYGVRFMLGNEYNVDDIVYVNGKKCRIIRMGIYKTTFYVIDEPIKFHIPNNKLQNYIIEKELIQK